ncbi:MAG: DUF5799 family protein [Halanaeroarchaeum sp.]
MTDADWRDRIVGARMDVDDEFTDRIADSSFSPQQWSLVMTATEFEIEAADDPDRARLVANTDDLDAVLPELESVGRRMPGGRDGGESGGLLDDMKAALGLGDGGDGSEHADEARELAAAYARRLQATLEERGRWEEIRSLAAED